MYLVLSKKEVFHHWENIKNDPCNNNPRINNPQEYIHKAKQGLVYAGGVQIIISDRLPKFK